MSGVFVDAPILVCSEDGADVARRARACEWLGVLWQRRIGRLSTQVLTEFYVTVTQRRHPPMPGGDARAEVRRYEQWQPWQIDHGTVESAWAVESRYGLHFWDALTVASAQHLGCKLLLSEDLPHAQLYGEVQVINPFNAPLSLLDSVT